MIQFEQILSDLIQFEPIWSNLIWLFPIWTNFIWFELNYQLIQFEAILSDLNFQKWDNNKTKHDKCLEALARLLKLKKILGFRNMQEKLEKRLRVDYKELTSRIDYCPTGTIDSSPKVEVSTDLSTPVSIFNFVGPLLS